jgi:hypothetical protein
MLHEAVLKCLNKYPNDLNKEFAIVTSCDNKFFIKDAKMDQKYMLLTGINQQLPHLGEEIAINIPSIVAILAVEK